MPEMYGLVDRSTKYRAQLAVLNAIKDLKGLLFGKFSDTVTSESKIEGWGKVIAKAKSLGVCHESRDAIFARNSLWATWKVRTMKKIERANRLGTAGRKGLVLDEMDELVLEILGRENVAVPPHAKRSPIENDDLDMVIEVIEDRSAKSSSGTIMNGSAGSAETVDQNDEAPLVFFQPLSKDSKTNDNSGQHEYLSLSACGFHSKQDDEFDVAKVWAAKLKTLAADQKLFAEKAINDVLFEAQLGGLSRHSVKINDPTVTQQHHDKS